MAEGDELKEYPCKHCGRHFASQISKYRHIRQNCRAAKISPLPAPTAPTPAAVEQQLEEHKRVVDLLAKQVAELSALLHNQLVSGARNAVSASASLAQEVRAASPFPDPIAGGGPVAFGDIGGNANVCVNVGAPVVVNNITQVNIRPWDGEDRISVPVGLIAAAFAENSRLAEYADMGDEAKTDPETAGPYVLEALIDLTRRAHADPNARNICLNPSRADQVLVCLQGGVWEVRSLEDATRLMFEGVATGIRRAIRTDSTRMQLSTEVQGSASYVPMMYDGDPDGYVKKAKVSISAHLANTDPRAKGRQKKMTAILSRRPE